MLFLVNDALRESGRLRRRAFAIWGILGRCDWQMGEVLESGSERIPSTGSCNLLVHWS